MIPVIRGSGLALIFLLFGCGGSETKTNSSETDPVLVEFPVVFLERDIITQAASETDEAQQAEFNARNPFIFNPGAKLFVKSSASALAPREEITQGLFVTEENPNPRFDIKDLALSPDGNQLLMSIRAPDNEDGEAQPSWNIWLYQHDTGDLRRIMQSDTQAEQGHDLHPQFLPDGRIIFASTRQRLSKAILLDEGRPQYTALDERRDSQTLNLHVMDADGENIKQISFNMSHDFYPLVRQNGKILYSRWDSAGGNNSINLYQMNPDGSENQFIYGWHSHPYSLNEQNINIQFIRMRQLPSGQFYFMLTLDNNPSYQKLPLTIDIDNYTEAFIELDGDEVSDSAQQRLFVETLFDFDIDENINLSGQLTDIFALRDNSSRYLMSLSLCRVQIDDKVQTCRQTDELNADNVSAAEPIYELWLYDQQKNTQQLVVKGQSGKLIEQAIVMQSAPSAEFIADKQVGLELDAQTASLNAGILHIRSVYDLDGQSSEGISIDELRDPMQTPAEQLPARFLKLIRGVPMPPRSVRNVRGTDFGRSSNQLMREIIGYTPIQPDGSVKVVVPANTPFTLSLVDASGQRISPRHNHWLSVKSGEMLECKGCHERNSNLPHGRLAAGAPSINAGAAQQGSAFNNTQADLAAEFGETMAETLARLQGLAYPSANLNYTDVWSDPAISVPNPEISLSYDNLSTPAPNGYFCFDNWQAYCRIQINYVEHIQAIWQLDRKVIDEENNEVIEDNSCIACHSTTDADGLPQVAAAQLELTGQISDQQNRHLTSYRELFFNDNEQEVLEGILRDKLIEVTDENGNTVFEVDEEGELILDADEQPIPVLTTVTVRSVMSSNGAQNSRRFFDLFLPEGSHYGRLTADELRLISEWLDIGAQYYNTPFYQTDD
ncbi:hypothetical protein [Catenovulum sediminis]|uniref:HzsA-related protein n=1 Tax=Catenovulum sediminis TaxID=1740262 RepID=UPI00117F9E8D|nr:hypothetical protein [Catenovulum sediminis]